MTTLPYPFHYNATDANGFVFILDQGHIGTVCTRVQFAVDRCPAASIYGHATVKTPLFAEPLTGAVYLRSSDNLSASLPQALGDWGYVDRIKLTLRRKYRHRGRQRSYFNAACPAPKVFKRTVFPLAEVTFGFEGRRAVSVTVSKSCAVKEPG